MGSAIGRGPVQSGRDDAVVRGLDCSHAICLHILLACMLLAGCVSVRPPVRLDLSPEVAIAGGSLRGQSDGVIATYKGIPYAEPPIGARRWKAPVPRSPWKGTRAATAFGPACVQPDLPVASIYNDPPIEQSEDCLSLNIWAPEHAENAPVVIWIHGGSLRIGAGSLRMYDGAAFARRGIVFISINYRLGALGWLAHPQLSAENSEGISGNYGLLDQIAALRWVQSNVSAFGGDPENVTIMGESAGALSATYLLASPSARGLFHKAIIQSPNSRSFPDLKRRANGLPSAETIGQLALKAAGAEDIGEARRINARTLIDRTSTAGFPAQGTIDGVILPRQIIDIFDHSEQAVVPILAGFNSGEVRSQRAFLPPWPASESEYVRLIRSAYGDLTPQFLSLYPFADGEESAQAAARDGIYGWAAERLVSKQSTAGAQSYLYVFDYCYPEAEARNLCAFHASDVPFVLGNMGGAALPEHWPVPGEPDSKRLSEAMIDYWTSFARDGRPRSAGNPHWAPYAQGQSFMKFDARPHAAADPYPGMLELNEAFVERRKARNLSWGLRIGVSVAASASENEQE